MVNLQKRSNYHDDINTIEFHVLPFKINHTLFSVFALLNYNGIWIRFSMFFFFHRKMEDQGVF